MSWRTRTRPPTGGHPGLEEERPPQQTAIERGAPGLAALLESLSEDGRHSILDLGSASGARLAFLGRFGHRIRFGSFLAADPIDVGAGIAAVIPPDPERPYDVVLAWDVLTRLDGSGRSALMERLAEVTAPGARLYTLVTASSESVWRPVRSTILAHDRVSMEPIGPDRPLVEPLLPAAVERLLAPFRITHAFTLRVGLREYVAQKAPG